MNVSSVTREQRWRAVLAQHQVSGQSVAVFCRDQELAPARFYHWKRRLGADSRLPGFVEVRLGRQMKQPSDGEEPTRVSRRGIELHLPSGIRLRVRRGFDQQLLVELLDALERRLDQAHRSRA